MSTGGYILLAAVVLALALGTYRTLGDGRFRGTRRVRGADAATNLAEGGLASVLEGTRWAGEVGERATFVQFSSAFCAPCRTTRRILEEIVAELPGVVHIEVDAEHHLDLVRRLKILRTPTTLVLSPEGHELTRASGVPRREQVHMVLGRLD